MKDTKFRILLDIHEVRSQATIPVKVGDVSCKIYITLVEGGKPYKIHENSFGVFTGKKGDDNYIFNNCIVENGIIRYDFTPQTVAAAGVLECEIRIYDEDGGVLTTPSFNIVVDERAVNDSELASASEFAFLDEILVNEGQRIENERNRNEAFNNLGIDLEDDGEVISIVKTDIDGSQEKASFLKYADVIPPVTATATGSAITIESSQAPIPYLKLSGKTTKNGDTLTSTGDSGSFEVGVYGGNVFVPEVKNTTVGGLTVNIDSTGVITLNGTLPGTNSFKVGSLSGSGKFTIRSYWNGDKHGSYLTINPNGEGAEIIGLYSVTINKKTSVSKNIDVVLYAGTYNNVELKLMINVGSSTKTLEPCNKQTLTMPYTLRSVGDIKDEVDFNRGMKTQRAYAVDLSTLEWTMPYGSIFSAFLPYSAIGTSWGQTSNILCTHYKPTCVSGNGMGVFDGGDDCITLDAGASVNYILVKDSSYTDSASFKASLGGVYLVYPLATPIETPISETELNDYRQLYTNKGNTTILSEADMEVEYYINKPNAQAIGNIHSQVNKDYFKLQQAIISTGGN